MFQELGKASFTFMRGDSASRIDRFYAPKAFVDKVLQVESVCVPFTDHSALIMKFEVDENSFAASGRGFWKINNALLEREDIAERFRLELQHLKMRQVYNSCLNSWWNNALKTKTRSFYKNESWIFNQSIRCRKSSLYAELNNLAIRQQLGENVADEMMIVKSQLLEIEQNRLNYLGAHLPTSSLLNDEKMNIYQVSALVNRYQSGPKFCLKDGSRIVSDVVGLKKIIFDYFTCTFRSRQPLHSLDDTENPINHLTRSLSREQQTVLTAPISEEEILKVLQAMLKKEITRTGWFVL